MLQPPHTTHRLRLGEARILHSNLYELYEELDEVLFVFRVLVVVEEGALQLVDCRDVLYLQYLGEEGVCQLPTFSVTFVRNLQVIGNHGQNEREKTTMKCLQKARSTFGKSRMIC